MSNFNNTSNQNNNIYSKPCVYNCGVQIYWNAATSEYLEVFTKKKHICPNRVHNKPSQVTSNNNTSAVAGTTTSNTKPTYYSKSPGIHNQNQRCPIPSNY